jgi:hypothetical protein
VIRAGAVLAAPQVVPGIALGKDGAVPPSEKIVMAGIGIGGRGTGVLGEFLRQLRAVHAHPGGLGTRTSGWPTPEPEPPKEEVDWDLFLGTAAWRPFSRSLLNSGFEKGGGMVGGGVLECRTGSGHSTLLDRVW